MASFITFSFLCCPRALTRSHLGMGLSFFSISFHILSSASHSYDRHRVFLRCRSSQLAFRHSHCCCISLGDKNIITLASDTVVNGDVFIAPSGRCKPRGLTIAPGLVRFNDGRALIAALNPNSSPVMLPQGTAASCFADTEPFSLVSLHEESPPLSASTDPNAVSAALNATINPDLTAEQKRDLLDILQKHSISFDVHSKVLGCTSITEHRIETDAHTACLRRNGKSSRTTSPTCSNATSSDLHPALGHLLWCWSGKRTALYDFVSITEHLIRSQKKEVYPLP